MIADPFSELFRLFEEAVRGHGTATADLVRRSAAAEEVDLVAEGIDCMNSVIETSAKFFLYWDNFATLFASDPGPGRPYPDPPRGGPNCATVAKVQLAGGRKGTTITTTGLRHRGTLEVIEPGMIQIDPPKLGADRVVDVTVKCAGALRGVYEGTLRMGQRKTAYNVYVDPSP